ncbi:hypothetical protein Tco_0148145, partial [Tanacetum coccineum]
LPLPPLPVSLFIPPPIDRREDIPEAELPPHKRLCRIAPTSRFIGTMDAEIRRQRVKEVGYGIRTDRLSYFRELMDWSRMESFTMRQHDCWIGRPAFPERLGHIPLGVTDDDIDCTGFITTRTVVSGIGTDLGTSG